MGPQASHCQPVMTSRATVLLYCCGLTTGGVITKPEPGIMSVMSELPPFCRLPGYKPELFQSTRSQSTSSMPKTFVMQGGLAYL